MAGEILVIEVFYILIVRVVIWIYTCDNICRNIKDRSPSSSNIWSVLKTDNTWEMTVEYVELIQMMILVQMMFQLWFLNWDNLILPIVSNRPLSNLTISQYFPIWRRKEKETRSGLFPPSSNWSTPSLHYFGVSHLAHLMPNYFLSKKDGVS